MRTTPRILALAGSLREASFNAKLLHHAIAGAEAAGAEVTALRMGDYPLPLYDQDVETAEGLPEPARRLKDLFRGHAGLLIASPEYNGSVSGGLKNLIDWVSRPESGREPLDCFRGRVAGILSAAAGGLGGMRGLAHLRSILNTIGVLVLPQQVTVPAAHDAFGEDGQLTDAAKRQAAEALGAVVAETVRKLAAR
jgi:NAD(P)H-dependent FMN reductase